MLIQPLKISFRHMIKVRNKTECFTISGTKIILTGAIVNVCVRAAGGSGEPGSSAELEVLQKRVRRQETLLQRCKELINTNKERSAQLSSENDALQQQLQERLQELEKIKVYV